MIDINSVTIKEVNSNIAYLKLLQISNVSRNKKKKESKVLKRILFNSFFKKSVESAVKIQS